MISMDTPEENGPGAQGATLYRTKLEVLYRDLLADVNKLFARAAEISARQEACNETLASLPSTLRQVTTSIGVQAAAETARAVDSATRCLANAERQTIVAAQALTAYKLAQPWLMAGLAFVSGLAGGLVGALLAVLALG